MKCFSTIFFLFISVFAFSQEFVFDYKKFKEVDGLSFSSDATVAKSKIQLTPAKANRRGGVWYGKKKVAISDTFDISFCFKIYQNGGEGKSGKGGEGLALVFHNNEAFNINGNKKEGLGYEGIPNSVAIEFDVQNTEDMGEQHVSIQTRGIQENSHLKEASIAAMKLENINLKDGRVHHVQITYNNPQMIIYIDGKKVLRFPFNIMHHINLDQGKGWVGITASTGNAYSIHELSCFSMKSKPKKIPYTEDREIKQRKQVTVNTRVVKIFVWDDNQEDGDIISVQLNGKWVIQNFTLTKAGDEFEVELEGQQNFLILHAHNLGSIPPNTAGVAILDENGNQQVTMRSNMQVSEALNIQYHKKNKESKKTKVVKEKKERKE